MKNIANPEEINLFSINDVSEPESIEDVIFTLMVNPNLSTINYFNDFSDPTFSPASLDSNDTDESGIFEIDSTGNFLSMTTHAFHHHLSDNPQKATEMLVARAARKMMCSGAIPKVVSAFLYHIDFADPHGQFIASGAKRGLENASKHFQLIISDKKIRFDHFKGHSPVPPTIIISMMGIVEKGIAIVKHDFKSKGNNIFLIGRQYNDINASEYLEFYQGISISPLPFFEVEEEIRILSALKKLHELNLLSSASPVGKGGLFFTLLRSSFANNLGFDITSDAEFRKDAFLFGEAMGRIVVDIQPEKEDEFVDLLSDLKIPFFMLGHVTKGEIRIDDVSLGYVDKMNISV
jgi:phosphoribosylformylglycinamidine (FGAM) synthase-like enzyme